MTSIFHYLPPTAVRGGLLWPALLGTMPTVLYIALPIAVGVAIMLEFIRMSSEGMIAVLYSLRLSVWSICLPAVSVAIVAVGIGYWMSSFLAPTYAGDMHDVIYVIRNSLNHRMLEPAHFYTFDDGRRTLYFQRWRTPDIATNIFINQINPEKKEEQIITAAEAEFRRNEQGVVLILSHGSIQTRAQGSVNLRAANFDEYVMPIAMQGSGGMPKRAWRGVFEMSGGSFFADRANEAVDPHRLAEWTSEAAKRLGIPILALTHVLFGIGPGADGGERDRARLDRDIADDPGGAGDPYRPPDRDGDRRAQGSEAGLARRAGDPGRIDRRAADAASPEQGEGDYARGCLAAVRRHRSSSGVSAGGAVSSLMVVAFR